MVISTSPEMSTGFKPRFVTSTDAMPADTMIASVSGRYDRPVFSAS